MNPEQPAPQTPEPTPNPVPTPASTPPQSPQTPPTLTPSQVPSSGGKLKWIILAVVVVILAVGAYVYFQILPSRYAKAYSDSMATPSANLKSAINKAADSYSRPVFTTMTTPDDQKAATKQYAKDKADLKYASDSIGTTATALTVFNNSAAKITILPGTGWTKPVRDAKSKQQGFKDYGAKAGQFVNDYRVLEVYVAQFVDSLYKIGTLADATINGPAAATSEAGAKRLDSVAAEIDNFTATLQKGTTPSYLSDFNKRVLKDFDQLATAFRDMAAGARNEDPSKLFGGFFELGPPSVDLGKLDFPKILKTKSPIPAEIKTLQ